MKTKLLFLALLLCSWVGLTQITAGQVDDFQDGSIQGWIIGNGNPQGYGTSVMSNAGPDGAGDNALDYSSFGGSGVGSKMVIFNQNMKWQGDYITANIVAIKLDVKAETNDLNIRIAFQRGPDDNFTRIATSNPVTVTAGSGWTSVVIPISPSDFQEVDNYQGDYTVTEILQEVSIMRVLSNSNASWLGESIAANMQLDNITASTTLDVEAFVTQNEFEISPNPASSQLNIKLADGTSIAKVVVYDVLGKKVYDKTLNTMLSSIDVSKWNTGVYLVRLATDNKTVTKRFVKQ